MSFKIEQEAMTVFLCILVAIFAINFVNGCWEYKTETRIQEINRGIN